MSAIADLSEEEKYLLALLQDQSGIDMAELSWTDGVSRDGNLPVLGLSVCLVSPPREVQIDLCGRALGKSLGIQMRAFAFPFCHAGQEMLVTAPELIHLDPVRSTSRVESMDSRISREFLKDLGKGDRVHASTVRGDVSATGQASRAASRRKMDAE